MFVPGNNPAMMQDAFIYSPDSIMLDLEDSVTMSEKDAARLLVYNALKTIDYGQTEMVVRINPLNTPYGKKDVEAMVKAGVQVIRMPKTETADEVREVEAEILKWEEELGCVGRTKIMAAIESALGIVNAYPIAVASKRMMGIALGAEDYCANLKTQRTSGDPTSDWNCCWLARPSWWQPAPLASMPSTRSIPTSTTWKPSAAKWNSSRRWASTVSRSSTRARLKSSTKCSLRSRKRLRRP